MEENKNVNEPVQEETVQEETAQEETAQEHPKETADLKDRKKEKSKDSEKSEKKTELESLKEQLENKEREIAELKDKYLRLAAEYDNFRKRSSKEKEGIYSDAVSDTVKDMLPVIDNLERAAIYSDAEKVAEGLSITAKSAKAMLSKMGITEFAVAGDKFNPNLHNAVMHVEDDSVEEGTIIEVFQRGYKRNDKIIRYAMVKVAN